MQALRADRFPNAGELAERCEVSRRTIYRDLDVLAQAGIPIEYRADRQGYQLAGAGLISAGLDVREVAALLALAEGWPEDGLTLGRLARAGARKLLGALPEGPRERALDLAERIVLRDDRPTPAPGRWAIHEAIFQALATRVQVRIWSSEGGTTTASKVSPYRLVLADRIWRLVGRSTWHRRVHTFRVPWITDARLTGDPAAVPPRFDLRGRHDRPRASASGPVRLRFDAGLAPIVEDVLWRRVRRLDALPGAGVSIELAEPGWDDLVGWVLGLGDGVEVLDPPEFRAALASAAATIARRYGDPLPFPALRTV